eukprot:Anaeramoba_flamelloidesa1054883_111.p1 GENE.a1054883_111~~a1054883_111.p1  ORF type:complete len:461 (+),score=115.81 a1054883_111:25-1383(+)
MSFYKWTRERTYSIEDIQQLNMEITEKQKGSYKMKKFKDPLHFEEGFFYLIKAIQNLKTKIKKRPVLVAISGPSGAGKTTISNKVLDFFSQAISISMDNYLDTSKHVIDENFDDYRLVDFDLLKKNLQELMEGKETKTPLYDFRKSGRYAYETISCKPGSIVILEGIYALHDHIRDFFDFKVFISGGVHYDLVKRIERDISRTGQTPKESFQQITETVYPMYKAFVEPTIKYAQLKIRNRFNPFTALLNPIYSIKSDTLIEKEKIKKLLGLKDYMGGRLQQYNDIYLRPPSDLEEEFEQETSGSESSSEKEEENNKDKIKDWIRVRNNVLSGNYEVQFSQVLHQDDFLITPSLKFAVSVKILSGLLSLGYTIDATIKRKARTFYNEDLGITIDTFVQMKNKAFIQIKGNNREKVKEAAKTLGFLGKGITKSYLELYFDYTEEKKLKRKLQKK